ncbi:PLP-dependent aminotransferase family protein [Intrasporangium mesophilum]
MDLHVTLTGSGDLTAQIYGQLRTAILDGRLAGGDRLPASRELAGRLSVARGTVTAAYDRLLAEDLLVSRPGAGTFVCTGCVAPVRDELRRRDDARRRDETRRPDDRRPDEARGRRARPGVVTPTTLWRELPAPSRSPGDAAYDFSVGVPDDSLFPLATWRRLVSGALRRGRISTGTYEDLGPSALEAEIARYAGLSRSVVAAPADVVTTAGAQQALDLIARVLVEPGDVVAVEDPGYTAAARLFETHRARVRGVPVDAEGIVVEAIPAITRLVYVTPSHQHPTGVAMSRARRIALLEWAVRHGAVIVEDDYDSEFRFADRPLEPLQSLDRDGRVVYVGSFSKSLIPALRVGYAIAPASLTPALREAKRVTVWDGDVVTQGALAAFLAEGHHAAHVKRATKVYRSRREALLQGLSDRLSDHVEVIPSAAGLHICTLLRDPEVDDVRVADAALAAGVFLDPLSIRHLERPARHGLVFGVGGIEAERIGPALEIVGDALRQAVSR